MILVRSLLVAGDRSDQQMVSLHKYDLVIVLLHKYDLVMVSLHKYDLHGMVMV